MTGVAVNVTGLPAQAGLADATIDTPAVSTGFTVMEMMLEVTGLTMGQAALDVRTKLMLSPLAGM